MSAWTILLIVIGAGLAAFTLLCCARILAKTGENGVKILIPFYGGFLFCKRTAEMGLLFWIQVVVAVIAGLAFLLSPLLGIFVLAAVLTPPDVVSQLALGLPMILLYEIGIQACRLTKPKERE